MITQLRLFNDDGEVLNKITMRGTPLGKDWYVMYEDGVKLLIKQSPNYATMKVYLLLSTMQSYDTYIITNIKHLSTELNMNYVTVWKAVKWLKEHNYIMQEEKNGQCAFILNPSVASKGRKSMKDKQNIFKGRPVLRQISYSKGESKNDD